MRRFALPLALSLGAHAALLAVCLLAPLSGPAARERSRAESSPGPFTLHFVRAEARPRTPHEPLPSQGEWINMNATVSSAPVLSRPTEGGKHAGPPAAPAIDRGGPGGSGGGPPLLAAGPQAGRVVYLIDCSVSMGPSGAFQHARAEVLASLRRLPPEAAFQVIAYTQSAAPLLGRPLDLFPATPDVLDQVADALKACAPTGLTDHLLAVKTALAYRPDLLFLLTDADDLRPAAARALEWLPTGATTIHVVELSGSRQGPSDGPLARLAARTGGSYRRVRPE